MIRLSRVAITIFTLAFGFYHGILGLLNLSHYEHPLFAIAAIAIYFAALIFVMADRPGLRLRDYKAAIALIVSMLVALLMPASVGVEHVHNHSTWHVAGIATLMAIIALRQHKVMAWFGVILMTAQVLVWGGLGLLFNAGIFGALMLVAAAHAASVTLAATSKAASDFREQALATAAATAAKSAARVERQRRVENALGAALPILNQIEQHGGRLTATQKQLALELEAMLRDQIRGRNFDLPELLVEVAKARSRGVEVQVLDDGGLDQLPEESRESLLKEVAGHVAAVKSGKLVLRSVADEKWTVSITASQPGSETPDLFLRL